MGRRRWIIPFSPRKMTQLALSSPPLSRTVTHVVPLLEQNARFPRKGVASGVGAASDRQRQEAGPRAFQLDVKQLVESVRQPEQRGPWLPTAQQAKVRHPQRARCPEPASSSGRPPAAHRELGIFQDEPSAATRNRCRQSACMLKRISVSVAPLTMLRTHQESSP
jgi:hypothetical protein